jgi:hypothetical protein
VSAQAQPPMEPELAALIASGKVMGPIADNYGNEFMLRLRDGFRFALLLHTNALLCESCLCQVARKGILTHVCKEWWKQ